MPLNVDEGFGAESPLDCLERDKSAQAMADQNERRPRVASGSNHDLRQIFDVENTRRRPQGIGRAPEPQCR